MSCLRTRSPAGLSLNCQELKTSGKRRYKQKTPGEISPGVRAFGRLGVWEFFDSSLLMAKWNLFRGSHTPLRQLFLVVDPNEASHIVLHDFLTS